MKGKDIQVGTIVGDKRVTRIVKRGRYVLYGYDYLVSNDRGTILWYRQSITPFARIHCNKTVPEPTASALIAGN